MFKLRFDTDNDVFVNQGEDECARILREVADQLENYENSGAIRDANGNTVGSWAFTPPRGYKR